MVIDVKGTRVHPHLNLPHTSYLGTKLKKCPSCGGGVVLEQVRYAGMWHCIECGDNYLYALAIDDVVHVQKPRMYTPLEVARAYPTINHNERPRDVMWHRKMINTGRNCIFY